MLLDPLIGAGDRVTTAIRSASQSTGTSFDYLLKTAMRESALDPKAKATTSSARGLYQFIESTWLRTLKEEGPRYGLAQYADAIERTADGRYAVRDPRDRASILKLRENPEIAAVMAGAFANRNAAEISSTLGRKPTSGELYAAHFLGAAGARRLFALKSARPDASAAEVFPQAAAANQGIFYRRDGTARSAAEVYTVLTARHDRAPATPVPPPNMATAAIPAAPAMRVAASAPVPATPAAPAMRVAASALPAALAAPAMRVAATALPAAPATPAAPAARMAEAAPAASHAANGAWKGPLKPIRTLTPAHAASVAAALAGRDTATPNPVRAAFAVDETPMFQAMFRTEAGGAVSPAVRELWGTDPTARQYVAVSAPRDSTRTRRDLSDLEKPAVTPGGRRSGLGT